MTIQTNQPEEPIVLITGGGGGIGRAMAVALLDSSARFAIVDNNSKAAETVTQELIDAGAQALAVNADVGELDQCEQAVNKITQHFGRIDALVNNAGIGVSSIRPDAETKLPSLEELTPELWARFFAVNMHGPFYLSRAVVPGMKARGWGRIVNNTTSFFTMLRVLPYGATKAALESASAVWAKELDGSGVTVNVIVPGGPTDTPFISDEAGIPRAKMLRPDVMGPPLRWLLSDEADKVTGQRFIGGRWNPALPPAEAAQQAGMPIGWPELAAATVLWPD